MTSLWLSDPTTGHDSAQTNSRNHPESRFRGGLRDNCDRRRGWACSLVAEFKKVDLIIVPIRWIILYQMLSLDIILTTIIDSSYAERTS
jgi:hypothetical protein